MSLESVHAPADAEASPGIDQVRAPVLSAVNVAFPPHRHRQEDVMTALIGELGQDFSRFAEASGVAARNLSLPLDRYREVDGFTEFNEIYGEVALDLSATALLAALEQAGVRPDEVDVVFTTTVTGLMVPTLDTYLIGRVGLRPDVKRVPLFGLGCVAGAAGVARLTDYLRAFPDQVGVLVAVELCSLTVQRDMSMANLVATSLFGDGAGVVVGVGANRAPAATGQPSVLGTRSRLYPDSQHVMGWDIGATGFKVVLSADVPAFAEKYLADDVQLFLADFGLAQEDISTWICHPGGPAVIEAVEATLRLPDDALARTRESLRENGNMSSVSILDVFGATLAEPPVPGSFGLMIAMGPGFCSELVLLRW